MLEIFENLPNPTEILGLESKFFINLLSVKLSPSGPLNLGGGDKVVFTQLIFLRIPLCCKRLKFIRIVVKNNLCISDTKIRSRKFLEM